MPEVLPDFPSSHIKAKGLQGKTLNEVVSDFDPITDLEMKSLVAEFGLIKPDELMVRFDRSSQWSWKLREAVKGSFSGKYVFRVADGKHNHCELWCPANLEILAVTLRSIVAEHPDRPLGLEIKRHYPESWPNASSGDQAVDEVQAALQWLKDLDRSGTHSSFLNEKRA